MESALSSRPEPVTAALCFRGVQAASCGAKHVAPLSHTAVVSRSGTMEGTCPRHVRAHCMDPPGHCPLDTKLVLRTPPNSGPSQPLSLVQ